jgi:hypothetical protein
MIGEKPKKGARFLEDWSEAELSRLKAMARRKVDAQEIALTLGRHTGSVKKKARELGLVPRKR